MFKGATVDQRKRVIVFAMRYTVTFMAVLEKLYSALNSCRQGGSAEDGAKNLDIAVAYYVGSLEGEDVGGSYDGSLIYMLAKRMCVHFNTCTPSNNAMVNELITSLFYTGQGEVETGVSMSAILLCHAPKYAANFPCCCLSVMRLTGGDCKKDRKCFSRASDSSDSFQRQE